MKRELSRDISKNTQISSFLIIRPVGATCSMRRDGQTDRQRDMTKLIVAFRTFFNASNVAYL